MERSQFTWYRSYYEALRTLPAKDFKVAVLAICAYALDEEVPSLSGVPNSVFTLIRPTLDSGRNKAANRLNKRKTNQEQTDNKPEQTRKEKEGEGEREEESEREGEGEGENECLKILPPGGGNTKSPAAAAGVSPFSSAVAMVQADYLNRVNAAASPASLDELAGFVEAMGPDCCRRAFDIALDERITRWSYIRGILQDKQQRGVKCLADWDALDNRRRERGGNGQRGQERKSWTDICEEMEGAT
jgi:hypothetical protein